MPRKGIEFASRSRTANAEFVFVHPIRLGTKPYVIDKKTRRRVQFVEQLVSSLDSSDGNVFVEYMKVPVENVRSRELTAFNRSMKLARGRSRRANLCLNA